MKARAIVQARRASGGSGDPGFTLIEVVVALMLTVLVMTVTAGFFIRTLAVSRLMQQRQAAVGVAEIAMDRARAEPVAAYGTGRDSTVSGGETTAGGREPAYRVSNVNFSVRTIIAQCWTPQISGACGLNTSPQDDLFYRVRVQVTWRPGAGEACAGPGGACTYTASTLRDPSPLSVEQLDEIPS